MLTIAYCFAASSNPQECLKQCCVHMLLLHAGTGGWAGGEAGLWQLREQVLQEKQQAKKASSAPASQTTSTSSKPVQPPAAKDGLAPIYVGYGKE
jgi:hypothetical protein